MTVIEQKKSLRKTMFEKRRQLDLITKNTYDNWVCSELEKLIISKGSKVVHSYIPFLGEIDISPLLDKLLQLNITVICPKTLPKRKLENRVLVSLSDLEVGIMGTQHPAQPNVYTSHCDFIIVPGLAFDSKNYRLGYGGGYYDNFLIAQPNAFKAGVFYPFQQVDAVPTETHDVRLDEILLPVNV